MVFQLNGCFITSIALSLTFIPDQIVLPVTCTPYRYHCLTDSCGRIDILYGDCKLFVFYCTDHDASCCHPWNIYTSGSKQCFFPMIVFSICMNRVVPCIIPMVFIIDDNCISTICLAYTLIPNQVILSVIDTPYRK